MGSWKRWKNYLRRKENAMTKLKTPITQRDHVQGAEDAPLTLVEYGDYECPHCGRAHPIVQMLQRRLGTSLRFVFRNFPLSELHPHALHAAEAAESVSEHEGEDAFWCTHDAIYDHQHDSPVAL